MTLTLRYTAVSHRGLIRSGNQDSVYSGPNFFAVADGMGGMAAGDIASQVVIEVMSSLDTKSVGEDLTADLADAVGDANGRLRAMVEENPQMEGMGTTLTAFLFSGGSLGMVHIGDSRAYRLRGERLDQITKDDTYVQMLVDEGQLSPEDAETHPQRSLLLRALGSHEVEPTFAMLEAVPQDRYLVCSDGLSGVVSDETLEQTLNEVSDLGEAADRLLQLALRGGGPDNITVLVADVVDDGSGNVEPIVAGAAAAGREEDSSPDPTSAAARAAATAHNSSQEEPAEVADSSDAAARRDDGPMQASSVKRRLGWYALTVLLLVSILVSGGYLLYQNQYYVGVDDNDEVAIFKGFRGEVLGLSLSQLEARSGRSVDDLTPDVQRTVEEGIIVDDLEAAQAKMDEVTGDEAMLLPLCDTGQTPDDDEETSTPGDDEDDEEEEDDPSPDASPEPTAQPGVDCRTAE